ncbi:hypothetical protein AB0D34_33140 [Streptomyces sp. NPDC048420]|uniref:hypothetical protein n=1 Tax=Streptomyces sp. NPDC048420 TaxID=3155755 RepID=UPI00341CEC9F
MHDTHEGERVRDVFEAMLDGAREPSFPGVTDAAVAGGRRIRRRRTAVSGAVGALVAAVLAAGVVAALPGTDPGRSSVPLSPASSPPATTTPGPASPSPVPSEASVVPSPSGTGEGPLTSPVP